MKKVLKSFFIFFIRDIFLEAGGNISQTFGPRNELVPISREILFVNENDRKGVSTDSSIPFEDHTRLCTYVRD